jgi:hypothetical protein
MGKVTIIVQVFYKILSRFWPQRCGAGAGAAGNCINGAGGLLSEVQYIVSVHYYKQKKVLKKIYRKYFLTL